MPLDNVYVEYVISHEKTHLKRLDYIIKPIGFLLLTVYWFNPLLWVAYVLLCRDIELACDEKVIKQLGEDVKKPYSEVLINCSVSRKMISACPLAFGEVGVKERIKGVLSYKKPTFWIIIVAVIATIVTAVLFLTNPPDRKSGEEMLKISEIEYTSNWTETELRKITEEKLVIEDEVEWGIGKTDNKPRKAYVLSYYESEDDDFHIPFLAVERDDKVIIKPLDSNAVGSMYEYFEIQDIDGDGVNEIILEQCVGMTGGAGQYRSRIFKVEGNKVTDMFYSASDNMYDTGFHGTFRDGFKLEIVNDFTDFSATVDFSKKASYIGKYFDENGKPLESKADIMLDNYYVFKPIDAFLDVVFYICFF